MKVAIVCDWLTNVGGAEQVLLSIHKMFPKAPIYTSKYDPKGIDWFLDAEVRTGWLQVFPAKIRRLLGPLRQLYFSHLDLSEYDLIISVTGAEAKSIRKGNAIHLCYCHVPTQYYWQFYDDYVRNPGFGILNPIVRLFFKLLVKPLRRADFKAAQRPDQFITISSYAAEMIKKYYQREASVVFPPVAVENFLSEGKCKKNNNIIITSRQVTWKRIDLAIKACLKVKQPLVVVGEGPEHNNLVKIANNSPLITFKPLMTKEELKRELEVAKGYVFPSLEPFGIAPVEALAAGCPVVAFGKGGALDYVKDGENGLLFEKQTVNSLATALKKFQKMKFNEQKVIKSALPFDEKEFQAKMRKIIDEKMRTETK